MHNQEASAQADLVMRCSNTVQDRDTTVDTSN